MQSRFHIGTAGFIVGLMALALSVADMIINEDYKRRISRLEYSLKAYCSGVPRLEACAEMDLPLNLDKFKQ